MAWAVAIINQEDRSYMRILRKHLRDLINPFDIAVQRFIEIYRFPQYLAMDLIDEINEFYHEDEVEMESHKIPLSLKVLASLNFYASGSYQRRVGMDALACMSQTMISRSITLISDILSTNMLDRYVYFPETEDQVNAVKERFFEESGYPDVLGLIDGTHVSITAVSKDIEMGFVNHKGFHSINTQIICDYDMKFININARYPGSTHDAYIWRNSKVFTHLKESYRPNQHSWLVGDSGYPLQPWLLIPFRNPVTELQQVFNERHCKLRCRVEISIGRFKNRFRCLIENEARYSPLKLAKIINSCAVLHNMLIEHGLNGEEFDQPIVEEDNINNPIAENAVTREGQVARNFVANYFMNNNN